METRRSEAQGVGSTAGSISSAWCNRLRAEVNTMRQWEKQQYDKDSKSD